MAFYVDVDDAKRLHDDLDEADVEILKRPHETDFGWRQFAVKDCNGYVLWFGEQLDDEDSEDIGQEYRTYHDHLADGAVRELEQAEPNRPPGERG